MREWLRLMANEQVTPGAIGFQTIHSEAHRFGAKKLKNSYQKNAKGEYDFSHEVKAAMDTCLA